jgi:hypothetical protein
MRLHSKNTPLLLLPLNTTRHGSLQPQGQNPPSVRRRNNTIIPQSGRRKRRLAFPFNAIPQLRIDLLAHGCHDRSQLFRAHDACFCCWPGPEEAWGVCAATASVCSLVLVLVLLFFLFSSISIKKPKDKGKKGERELLLTTFHNCLLQPNCQRRR